MRKNPLSLQDKIMAKNVTIGEIIRYKFKKYKNLHLIQKVIEMYFEIMYEYLLQGKIVSLPLNIGEFCIVKKKASELSKRKEKTSNRYENSVKKAIKYNSYNYSKLGYFYMISTKGIMYERGMYLKPPKHIKERITKNIINNKDYRYEKYGIYNDSSK